MCFCTEADARWLWSPQAGDGPAAPPASPHSPPQTPGAPAGLGTVGVSEKPEPCLVPLHWGHTKASHLDSEKNSQVMCPVKPKEAFLGSHGEPLGEGRRAQADPPEEALCVEPAWARRAGWQLCRSGSQSVVLGWAASPHPGTQREYVFSGRTSDPPDQNLGARAQPFML